MTGLNGKYFIRKKQGNICVNFKKDQPKVWFENNRGRFKVYPRQHKESNQLELPFKDMPEDVVAEIESTFTKTLELLKGFTVEQHCLLTFCMRYGRRGLDLASDCPALSFLLAGHEFYNFGRNGKCLSQLSPDMKRVKLLRSLGYPETKATARLFRKIPASECNWLLLSDLKKVLNEDKYDISKELFHVKKINHLLVKLLSIVDLWPWIRMPLLDEVSNISQDDERAQNISQILDIRNTLPGAIENGIKISALRNFADLDKLHHDLIAWLREEFTLSRIKKLKFPKPPFPGFKRLGPTDITEISPIKSGEALWKEGRDMNHCIAGYTQNIIHQNGNLYAYHLELPDQRPATMLIRKSEYIWQIEEIRGSHNIQVSPEVLSFALSWLEKQVGR